VNPEIELEKKPSSCSSDNHKKPSGSRLLLKINTVIPIFEKIFLK